MATKKGDKRVECIVANVHTSRGKLLKGQRADVPEDEAAQLIEAGRCEAASAGPGPGDTPDREPLDPVEV